MKDRCFIKEDEESQQPASLFDNGLTRPPEVTRVTEGWPLCPGGPCSVGFSEAIMRCGIAWRASLRNRVRWPSWRSMYGLHHHFIIIRQPLCPVVGRRPQHAVSKLPCLVLSSAISCRSSICPGRLSIAWLVSLVVFSCHMVSNW